MHQPHESPPVGHLMVHLEDAQHPAEVEFNFERQGKRMGGALGTSLLTHFVCAALFVLAVRFAPTSPQTAVVQPEDISDRIIWLAEPGPGGGGGGGGNKSPEPPRKAELPGKDKITVPVLKTPPLEPVAKPPDEEPQQALNIPAKTLQAALEFIPGAIEGLDSSPSLGTGSGGGAGTGTGTGIGSGTGSGLGPGTGGGTGGGAYRPGTGIDMPRLLRQVKPNYTAEAMRAKVQGIVWLECVVDLKGVCTEIEITRSLDPTFGLDREAINALKKWTFVPGKLKVSGQPVPVIVGFELEFSLR